MKTATAQRLNVIDSREDWLNAAIAELRPMFSTRGYELAEKIRVSCGWPAGRKGAKAIGQCWSQTSSADGTFELFISPVLDDPARVLDVLVHELAHVAVGIAEGHNRKFSACASAMHLVGPWTATSAGPDFDPIIGKPVRDAIGVAYPHSALSRNALTSGPKKQKGRMIKCTCEACGYTVRTTAKWIENGAPICPCNNEAMTVDGGAEGGDEDESGDE